jgi:SAM-dependent methyltransferase
MNAVMFLSDGEREPWPLVLAARQLAAGTHLIHSDRSVLGRRSPANLLSSVVAGEEGVKEGITRAVARYVLDGTDDDLKRLLKISELTAEFARIALNRVGVQRDWNAIECGCGPLGALPVLAEAVGSSGRVVGIDFNEGAVDRARSIMETLGISNVDVFVGDVHETAPAALGAPFELAYSRQFLLHQPDPIRTLTCIAALLRPGGVLIAQEPFRNPGWRSQPANSHLSAHWDILYESIERAGTPHGAVEDLPRFARTAGLEVMAMSGFCVIVAPEVGLQIATANMAAVRDRALALGAATEEQLDAVTTGLSAALRTKDTYQWIASPLVFDLALRKPTGPQ